MVKIGFLEFPESSGEEVAECYSKIAPPPDFIKTIGPYISANIEEGVRTITIFEFDEAVNAEATEYIETRFATFKNVPDLVAKIEDWLDVAGALETFLDGTKFDESYFKSQGLPSF